MGDNSFKRKAQIFFAPPLFQSFIAKSGWFYFPTDLLKSENNVSYELFAGSMIFFRGNTLETTLSFFARLIDSFLQICMQRYRCDDGALKINKKHPLPGRLTKISVTTNAFSKEQKTRNSSFHQRHLSLAGTRQFFSLYNPLKTSPSLHLLNSHNPSS